MPSQSRKNKLKRIMKTAADEAIFKKNQLLIGNKEKSLWIACAKKIKVEEYRWFVWESITSKLRRKFPLCFFVCFYQRSRKTSTTNKLKNTVQINSRGYEDSQINVCINTFHNKNLHFILSWRKHSVYILFTNIKKKFNKKMESQEESQQNSTSRFYCASLLKRHLLKNVGGNMYFDMIYQL